MKLTRRDMLKSSAAAVAVALSPAALVAWGQEHIAGTKVDSAPNPYRQTLNIWAAGMLAHQLIAPADPTRNGALQCPACGVIHGRCPDALYPFLAAAKSTGESKYVDAAVRVQAWSDNTTQSDGSFLNDPGVSTWKGITVFASITLAEALLHHGELLDQAVQQRWRDRLRRAAGFLIKFMPTSSANINYPITMCHAMALCHQVFGDQAYLKEAQTYAAQAQKFFSANHLIFGEGHPADGQTPKGCRAIDIGYNVEESLPALAAYATITGDQEMTQRVVELLQGHMEFMIPDGGWDNSTGSRNYKWTYWGSRTSDGCQTAYLLMAAHDPRFAEVARRNLQQMIACTTDGLLHGGPHYAHHGDKPCIHHTFTHAKALATVLDLKIANVPAGPVALPRDEAYGLKSFPELGCHLAAVGPWRATITEYDWNYKTPSHPSGGALSLLYHTTLGPLFAASMNEYALIEAHNQQIHGNYPTMPLTPRIEWAQAKSTLTNLNDFTAKLSTEKIDGGILFTVAGQLQDGQYHGPADATYTITYRITEKGVEIRARVSKAAKGAKLILPVIANAQENATRAAPQTLQISKAAGRLLVKTDAPQGFADLGKDRVFNLVPGFECIPATVELDPAEVTLWIQAV